MVSLDVQSLIASLRGHRSYADQIVHTEVVAGASARFADVEPPLPERLARALSAQGIERLWCHQAEALDLGRSGFPFVVTTPTASGKSLCYLAPVLEMLLTDRSARALVVYPTKALAQDQAGKLRDLGLFPDVVHALYDGDTPRSERASIRRTARLILTNPDMLHVGILPAHSQWAVFLRNLRAVVIDEAHVYRGVFGGHVSQVMRRLARIADRYGASPQWIGCSATIANPVELFRQLTGVAGEIPVVCDDGAPRGRRHFLFWNPPFLRPAQGVRRSTHSEATGLFTALVGRGVRTIVFARARKSAELLLAFARDAFASTESRQEMADRIASYRAGYTPSQRRAIERRLFDGDLLGVTATNALELGVDIGGMDAVVMAGYPGTISSAWQQAGRAGRRSGDSLAVLVASDNPLDQFLMRRPEWFFGSPHENAVLDPGNRHILAGHLLCAAWEAPLVTDDLPRFGGEKALRVVKRLVEQGDLAWRGEQLLPTSLDAPAGRIDIRSMSSKVFTILLADGTVLGTIEDERAYEQVHPGAVYLHQGESYVIEEMDLAGRKVMAVPCGSGIYSEPKVDGNIEILSKQGSKEYGSTVVYFGEVRVTKRVRGYRRRNVFTDETVGEWDLDLPEQVFETEAVWFPVPREIQLALEARRLDLSGTVHAVEHASIGLLPLFALCDRNDIGGVSTPYHPQVGAPAVFVHDAHPGGVGIAETGFRLIGPWLEATAALVEQCPCDDGCPACIQSPKCGNNNQPLDKEGAAALLKALCTGGES